MRLLLDHDRFIHSIKTAIAALIGFGMMQVIAFRTDQWLVITILVVMCAQMSVGSVFQKSYLRFLGSLAGSIIASITLLVLGPHFLSTAIIVTLSAMIFSYIATSNQNLKEAGTLGAVTVAIILIGPDPTLSTALERFIEISIGILIAACVSQLILPIHARRSLRDNQARTLRLIRDYYSLTLLNRASNLEKQPLEELDEGIVKLLIAQRQLAVDALREPLGKAYNLKVFKHLLWCEKEILRCLTFMHHAYQASPSLKKQLNLSPIVKKFHEDVCLSLEVIAERLEKFHEGKVELPSLRPLNEFIETLTTSLRTQEIVNAEGFLFCSQILVARLQRLIMLVREMNQLNKSKISDTIT